MSEEKKNNWFQALQDKINMLAEQFGLDETQRNAFRNFVVTIAREQYKTGNRAGAGWAFAQARKNQSERVVSHL